MIHKPRWWKLRDDWPFLEAICFTIEVNEHAVNYQALPDMLELDYDLYDEWESEEDKQDAINADQIYCVQWFPLTPVGSCRACGSTLEKAWRLACSGGES